MGSKDNPFCRKLTAQRPAPESDKLKPKLHKLTQAEIAARSCKKDQAVGTGKGLEVMDELLKKYGHGKPPSGDGVKKKSAISSYFTMEPKQMFSDIYVERMTRYNQHLATAKDLDVQADRRFFKEMERRTGGKEKMQESVSRVEQRSSTMTDGDMRITDLELSEAMEISDTVASDRTENLENDYVQEAPGVRTVSNVQEDFGNDFVVDDDNIDNNIVEEVEGDMEIDADNNCVTYMGQDVFTSDMVLDGLIEVTIAECDSNSAGVAEAPESIPLAGVAAGIETSHALAVEAIQEAYKNAVTMAESDKDKKHSLEVEKLQSDLEKCKSTLAKAEADIMRGLDKSLSWATSEEDKDEYKEIYQQKLDVEKESYEDDCGPVQARFESNVKKIENAYQKAKKDAKAKYDKDMKAEEAANAERKKKNERAISSYFTMELKQKEEKEQRLKEEEEIRQKEEEHRQKEEEVQRLKEEKEQWLNAEKERPPKEENERQLKEEKEQRLKQEETQRLQEETKQRKMLARLREEEERQRENLRQKLEKMRKEEALQKKEEEEERWKRKEEEIMLMQVKELEERQRKEEEQRRQSEKCKDATRIKAAAGKMHLTLTQARPAKEKQVKEDKANSDRSHGKMGGLVMGQREPSDLADMETLPSSSPMRSLPRSSPLPSLPSASPVSSIASASPVSRIASDNTCLMADLGSLKESAAAEFQPLDDVTPPLQEEPQTALFDVADGSAGPSGVVQLPTVHIAKVVSHILCMRFVLAQLPLASDDLSECLKLMLNCQDQLVTKAKALQAHLKVFQEAGLPLNVVAKRLMKHITGQIKVKDVRTLLNEISAAENITKDSISAPQNRVLHGKFEEAKDTAYATPAERTGKQHYFNDLFSKIVTLTDSDQDE